MKALWKNAKGELEFRSVPTPEIRAEDDVKIRVLYSLIGDYDLRMYRSGDFCARDGIAGYEMIGEITDLGSFAKASGFCIGDRVVSMPVLFCGKCRFCLSNQENRCVDIVNTQGTLCEHVVRKSRQLTKIPDHISNKQACFVLRISETLEAVDKLDPQFEDIVAILGGGLSALIAAQLFQKKGVNKVYLIEALDWRRDFVSRFGIGRCLNPSDRQFRHDMLNATDHIGFDSILETSSDIKLFHQCAEYIAPGGKLCLPLYYEVNQNISFNTGALYYARFMLITSFLFNKNEESAAIQLIPRLRLDDFITNEYTFDQAIKAFDELKHGHSYAIGIKMSN